MSLSIGLDIGTSSVKLLVCERSQSQSHNSADTDNSNDSNSAVNVLHSHTVPHHSYIHTINNSHSTHDTSLFFEQRIAVILSAIKQCYESIPTAQRAGIAHIGVSCQMHGVMLWNAHSFNDALNYDDQVQYVCDISSDRVPLRSNLITWQDQRCSGDFLSPLNACVKDSTAEAGQKLASGYGIASLAW